MVSRLTVQACPFLLAEDAVPLALIRQAHLAGRIHGEQIALNRRIAPLQDRMIPIDRTQHSEVTIFQCATGVVGFQSLGQMSDKSRSPENGTSQLLTVLTCFS